MGQGNYKLLSFDHSKDMTFSAKMPIVDLSVLGMLSNKPVNIGAVPVFQRDVLTSTTQKITLSQTPLTGTLRIYLLNGSRDIGIEQTPGTPATAPNTYSISGSTITLNITTAPDGTLFVCTYQYSAPNTTMTTTFTADKFAGYVSVNGVGIITDEVTGALVPSRFNVLKCKAQNNWTITMEATKATELDLTFDCYSVDIINGDGSVDKVYCTFQALE